MKMGHLIYLSSLISISAFACQDINYLAGKWKIIDAKNIINIDQAYWAEYKSICIGDTVFIGLTDSIMNLTVRDKCDSDGDFMKCDSIKITLLPIKIKADKDTLRKIPEFEFYSDTIYVNQTFLIAVRGNKVDNLVGYNTNCSISWGRETLKIISISSNRIVFYLYSYMLVLEKTE